MKTICELSTPSSMLPVKRKPMGGNVAMDDFFQARLVDRNLAGLKRLDLARVVIDADDVVADIGKTGAGDETDVTGTDD